MKYCKVQGFISAQLRVQEPSEMKQKIKLLIAHFLHELWTVSCTDILKVQNSTQQCIIVKFGIVYFSSDPVFFVVFRQQVLRENSDVCNEYQFMIYSCPSNKATLPFSWKCYHYFRFPMELLHYRGCCNIYMSIHKRTSTHI